MRPRPKKETVMKASTQQRATVVGVFYDRAEAERAVADLKRAGFRANDISVVVKRRDDEVEVSGTPIAAGAATGAAVGAGAAALASLGMTFGVIPIIGPILAVGPLAAALISAAGGAAAGGLVGALAGLGISESEAGYYEGEVKSGRTLVTVKADGRYDEAWTILNRFGAYNHEHRQAATATAASATTGKGTMKLHEEELHARKQPVETGQVRVRKEVVTEHQTLDVPVQREEVIVERHAVGGKTAPGASIRAGEEVRIPVHEEQVRVEKTPVVKEEVTVGKRTVKETEHVGGTVRKEELKVEKKGDVDVRTKGTGKDAGKGR